MKPRQPRPRHVSLVELAELCRDDAEALYWLSQQYPETIQKAEAMLTHWAVLRDYLDWLQLKHEDGDGTAALTALSTSDGSAAVLPYWASHALARGWSKFLSADPDAPTLESAFGISMKRHPSIRRKALFGVFAWKLVKDGERADNSIDRNLYEQVADKLRKPSSIPCPITRRGVESARATLEAEGRNPDGSLSWATVERWYGAIEKSRKAGEAKAKRKTAEARGQSRKHHFIFGK